MIDCDKLMERNDLRKVVHRKKAMIEKTKRERKKNKGGENGFI